MVVEKRKIIDIINNIKRHHSLSFEIICIEVRPSLVFSEKRGSQNSVQISKNCNWKDLAAFYGILFMTAISGHQKFSFETTYLTYTNKGRGILLNLSNFTLCHCTKFNKTYIFLVLF